MATDVIMPALGVAQEKGTLLHWLKAEGQSVTKGEPLMEVETDKATVEIEAPASGILTNVTASPGDEVPVGNRIAIILAPGAHPHPYPLPEGEGMKEERPLARKERMRKGRPRLQREETRQVHPLPEGEGRDEGRAAPSTAPPNSERLTRPRHAGERVLASPAAKRIAGERGIDLASLKGSGPGGAVVAEDVLRSAAAEAVPGGLPKIKETIQLSPMRRIVGKRMTKSKQTAPHFYLSIDADMTEVIRRRSAFKEKGQQEVPSINDFILHAAARALRDFPSLNAAFNDQSIHIYSTINIGMAVALEEGLVVPVIRNTDGLSLKDLSAQTRELADKAQKKKLFPRDYEGGTFTVSNLGMFGIDSFVAIINPPQCAILAVGQVAPRVVAFGEGIAVRPMMTMTLSADHRIVDGAIAAKFLQELKRLLESPN